MYQIFIMRILLVLCAIIALVIPRAEADQMSFSLHFQMPENNARGHALGRLNQEIVKLNSNSEIKRIFSGKNILYRLRKPSDLFEINESDSLLIVKRRIDVEELCPQYCKPDNEGALIELTVNLWEKPDQNEQFVGTITVNIRITDVDDNVPNFDKIASPYQIKLKENRFTTGKFIELPRAVDRDVNPNFSRVHYRLAPDDQDSKALNSFDLDLNQANPRLILRETMDFEQKQKYKFFLIAEAASNIGVISPQSPDRSKGSVLPVEILVINENDMEPNFEKPVYRQQVSENVALGTKIFQVGSKNSLAVRTYFLKIPHSSCSSANVNSISSSKTRSTS
ncbi:hypothetical protein Ciccas_003155 [Cichlidogyrus casuarinus]|uniref:Cadherin domain-containing protein n=1 Tax=Cichlidogyrus casuarinus TaxID=1844966 RepID=A0ABD2QF88_9PLAT